MNLLHQRVDTLHVINICDFKILKSLSNTFFQQPLCGFKFSLRHLPRNFFSFTFTTATDMSSKMHWGLFNQLDLFLWLEQLIPVTQTLSVSVRRVLAVFEDAWMNDRLHFSGVCERYFPQCTGCVMSSIWESKHVSHMCGCLSLCTPSIPLCWYLKVHLFCVCFLNSHDG